MLNEAALEAVRRGGQEIVQRDVDFAVDRVLQVRSAVGTSILAPVCKQPASELP